MQFEQNKLREFGEYYRHHLLNDIMPFWDARIKDDTHGGYLLAMDRFGDLLTDEKNVWTLGRTTYMYAALCNELKKRDTWLDMAKTGRDFLVKHAHADGGRWHYKLARDGSVIDPTGSLFTDAFALMGLAEYAALTGSDEDLQLIRQTFEHFDAKLRDPLFTEYHHFAVEPGCIYHGPHMIAICLVPVVRKVLGDDAVKSLADYCLHQILHVFAKDEYRVLFEVLHDDGSVIDTDQGRTINPGHTLECLWFCIEEGLYRGDRAIVERAATIAGWAYDNGYDREHGGLLAFTTPGPGGQIAPIPDNKFGEKADSKIWWVHSEALYTLALSASELDDADMFAQFETIHDYCIKHFVNHTDGDWYTYLQRDGTPESPDMGGWIKCPFHIPRALMKLVLLFERAAQGSTAKRGG